MSGSREENDLKPRSKIAYITGIFPALTMTFVMREIDALVKRGFEVMIFAVKRPVNGEIQPSLYHPDIILHCSYARPDNLVRHFFINIKSFATRPLVYLRTLGIFLRQASNLDPASYGRLLFHFFSGIGFSEEIAKSGVCHIHAHFATGTSVALSASLFSGVPFSWTAHATGDIFMKPILLEEKIKEADFVIAVCEYSKRYLDDVTGLQYSKKIHRIYNGIDLSELEKFGIWNPHGREASNRNGKPFRVISVGSLFGCKGHATLVKACKILKDKGYSVTCTIIGDGPERLTLCRLIDELDLQDSVFLKGYISLKSVYGELGQADAFALLSEIHINGYRDGFPTVILEAMAMSLPVVSTWISGIPEMVVNGETGFIVHERDYVAAADAIEKLILNDQMRSQFGKTGRERISRIFNLRESTNRLVDLFSRFRVEGKPLKDLNKEHNGLDESSRKDV